MENFEQSLDIETLLAGYVLGDLTPEETQWIQQHLTSHPELAAEVKSLQTTLALLPLSLPETSPPENLRSSILEAAANELKTVPQTDTETISQTSPVFTFKKHHNLKRFFFGITGTVAAVLVAGLGFQNYRLQQQLASVSQEIATVREQVQASQTNLSGYKQVVDMLNDPHNRLLTLKGMSPQIPASGNLVITPRNQAAFLTLQNLAALPKGQVYRMWAFVNNKKVDCATFTPNSQGNVMLKIPLVHWENATSVMITIEPEKGITEPTGEMVIMGEKVI